MPTERVWEPVCKCVLGLGMHAGPQAGKAHLWKTAVGDMCTSGRGGLWIAQGGGYEDVWKGRLLKDNVTGRE